MLDSTLDHLKMTSYHLSTRRREGAPRLGTFLVTMTAVGSSDVIVMQLESCLGNFDMHLMK